MDPLIWMKKKLSSFLILILISIFCYCIIPFPFAQAVNAIAPNQEVVEVKVHLGTPSGELKFVPNELKFVAGQKYKLLLDNPSPTKHYFTAREFADRIWTQKVDAGNVEVKGAINELELRPGANAQWVFIPMKAGTYHLRCTVAGHTEAGMIGTIIVSD